MEKLLNKSNGHFSYKNKHNGLSGEIEESQIRNAEDVHSDIKKRILFVLHSGSGGTPKTVNDIVKNIFNQYECYLLTSDTKTLKLFKYNNGFELIESYDLFTKWLVENCYIEEYSNLYFNLLIKYDFDIVHIHHLIFHSFDLPKVCNQLNIPVILSIHDLYYICPAYTLLDGDYKYCDGICSNSNSDLSCFMPMQNMTEIKNMKTYVNDWRKSVSDMFSNVNYFIAPSKFIKNIVNNNYDLNGDCFRIIEHGIDCTRYDNQLFEVPNSTNPTKILFLGNLFLQKGYPAIKELYEIDKGKNFEFHFLGFMPSELSGMGISHGKYDISELKEYMQKIKPSFVGIFTLCGESYCYTLSEAWSFGIPVLVSKLGALEERVLENGGGWFIDVNDMEKSYGKILSIIENTDEYVSKQKEINDIKLISTKSMIKEYLMIYNSFNEL